MKVAVTGKGGVGKTTLAAALAQLLAGRGRAVLAVDADPDANLAASLGLPAAARAKLVPLARQTELIAARTGAAGATWGAMFKLNPEVSDVADAFATRHRGIALLVLGAVERGGAGCACPASVFLKTLVSELVLRRGEALILDMEAGIEHLGRGTAAGVDLMIAVVEPGQRAVETALHVETLGRQVGIRRFAFVANKIASAADEAFVRAALGPRTLLGALPYCEALRGADRDGRSVLDSLDAPLRRRFEEILDRIEGSKPA